jgi:nitrite reductase/ring-hydroxylating ferredoxin subunit
MAQQLVTHVGAIASGAVAAFDVAGRRIAVANVGGTLFAFDDACTHRHCSLRERSALRNDRDLSVSRERI